MSCVFNKISHVFLKGPPFVGFTILYPHLEITDFSFTLHIVRYYEEYSVSETESLSILKLNGEAPTLLGRLERINLSVTEVRSF